VNHVSAYSDAAFLSDMKKLQERIGEIPDCWPCEIHGDYPSATDEGRAMQFHCPACAAQSAAIKADWDESWRRHIAWNRCGIPRRYANRSLDNWRARTPALAQILETVRRWVDQWGTGDVEALVLSGSVGLGKTHLAAGLIAEAIRCKASALYVSLPDLLSDLKASFDRGSETRTEEILRPLQNATLLVIDEIGVQKGSEYETNLIAQLVDQRYRDGGALVLLTNVAPNELPRYIGSRAADRLTEFGLTLLLNGDSYRTKAPEDIELQQAPSVFPRPPEILQLSGTYRGEMRTTETAVPDGVRNMRRHA
jgi:DNA replication protein DnaC